MKTPAWDDYKIEFVTDQFLLDVYVFDATLADWQKLLDFVRSGSHQIAYTLNGTFADLPHDAASIFRIRADVSVSLSVYLGGVLRVNVHFFLEDEIELDLQAGGIQTEAQAEMVFDFLQHISRLLNKEAALTSESAPGDVIFRLTPAGNRKHFPALTVGAQAVRGRFHQ